MASIVSQSTASSNTTTEAPAVRRVHVYLTDSDSEASNERIKRRKVSKQLYEPVWVQREPETHRLSHVKTYSVLVQWKPYPKNQEYAKWSTFVRKLELRNRDIDIFQANWEKVPEYEFDERPDLHLPGCRFVNREDSSWGFETALDGIARYEAEYLGLSLEEYHQQREQDQLRQAYFNCGIDLRGNEDDVSDLEDPEY